MFNYVTTKLRKTTDEIIKKAIIESVPERLAELEEQVNDTIDAQNKINDMDATTFKVHTARLNLMEKGIEEIRQSYPGRKDVELRALRKTVVAKNVEIKKLRTEKAEAKASYGSLLSSYTSKRKQAASLTAEVEILRRASEAYMTPPLWITTKLGSADIDTINSLVKREGTSLEIRIKN